MAEQINVKIHPDFYGTSVLGANTETFVTVDAAKAREYLEAGILINESYVVAEKKLMADGPVAVAVDDEPNNNATQRSQDNARDASTNL